jgi:putative phage-type endonuclease
MIIHDVAQRSPEWFALRRGIITASEVGKFIVNTDKKSLDARQNLIDKKLGEVADGDDTEPSYESYWMKRGTLLEPESIEAYEKRTGELVYHVGFVQHDTLPIGCSPDGLIVGKNFGIEGKAVAGKTQIGRLRDNVLPDQYVCQIHHSMIVMEAPHYDFWSYHPALPPFHVRTYRDDFTDKFERGLVELCAEYARQKSWIRGLWDNEMRREVA